MIKRIIAAMVLFFGLALAAAPVTEDDLRTKARAYSGFQKFNLLGAPRCVPDPPGGGACQPTQMCFSHEPPQIWYCENGTWTVFGQGVATVTLSVAADDTEVLFTDINAPKGAPALTYNKTTEETKAKVLNGVPQVNMYATDGAGTSGSPWTGWESALTDNADVKRIHFPAGEYATSSEIIISGNDVILTGDGSGGSLGEDKKSVINCTGTGGCIYFKNSYPCNSAKIEMSGLYINKSTNAMTAGHCSVDDAACTTDGSCDQGTYTQTCMKSVVNIGNREHGNCGVDGMFLHNLQITADTACLTCDDNASAIMVHNVNNGSIRDVMIHKAQPGSDGWLVGIDLFPTGSDNRGNIHLDSVVVAGARTGIRSGWAADRRSGGGVFNNVIFTNVKLIREGTDGGRLGSVGFDIYPFSTMTTIIGCHVEDFQFGIRSSGNSGTLNIDGQWFGHVGRSIDPDGIGLQIRRGKCSGDVTNTTYCDHDSECSGVGGTCVNEDHDGVSVTNSRFDVSNNDGDCSWCTTAPRQTCVNDAACPAFGTCVFTCGTGIKIPSGARNKFFLHNLYYRNVRTQVLNAGRCSTTTSTSCDQNPDCPAGETCESNPTNYFNDQWVMLDDMASMYLTRTASSDWQGPMIRLKRENENGAAIDLVDNYGSAQSYRINADDSRFSIQDIDSTAQDLISITPSARSTPDAQVGINDSTPISELNVVRTSDSLRTGPILILRRDVGDTAALRLQDNTATPWSWDLAGDQSFLKLNDVTAGTTPIMVASTSGNTTFSGQVLVSNGSSSPILRALKTGGTGATATVERTGSDSPALDFIDGFDTAQTWRMVVNANEGFDIQDMTAGGTPVRFTIAASTGAVSFSVPLADAQVSDTLTASIFKGSGTTTDAVDLATAEVAGTLPIARGGTNATATPTAGGVAYGTGSAYAITSAGTTGQVLTSNGASAPSFQTPAAGGYATIEDEGTPLTQRDTVNFVGDSVTCVDNAGSSRTDCTISVGAAVSAFADLTDTPADYTGAANKLVMVNSTPNALEFRDEGQLVARAPTDASWTDGINSAWVNGTTKLMDQIDDLNETLAYLAPADALTLNATTLTLSGASLVTGYASAGNTNYKTGLPAGSQYTMITNDNTYTLTTAVTSTTWNKADEGALKLYRGVGTGAASLVATVDLAGSFDEGDRAGTQGGTPWTNGDLSVTSVGWYNGFPKWQKGNATATYSGADTAQGYNSSYIVHDGISSTQTTTTTDIFYDNDAGANPSVSTPTMAEGAAVATQYISGVKFYDRGSQFKVGVVCSDCFDNTYVTNPVVLTARDGASSSSWFSSTNVPWNDATVSGLSATPAINETMTVTDKVISVSSSNVRAMNAHVGATPYDPFGSYTRADSSSTYWLVDGYDPTSTAKAEYFDDETYRQPSGSFGTCPTTTGQWTSSTALSNGNAQEINGSLQYPALTNYGSGYHPATGQPNYSGFTGNQVYYRTFQDAGVPHGTGTLTLSGLVNADVGAVGAGAVNVELKLCGVTGWLDLGTPYDSGTFAGVDGDGIKVSQTSNAWSWSVGTFSTASSSYMYVLRVTFRNSTKTIASIVESAW
jgi:hypothetical protein